MIGATSPLDVPSEVLAQGGGGLFDSIPPELGNLGGVPSLAGLTGGIPLPPINTSATSAIAGSGGLNTGGSQFGDFITGGGSGRSNQSLLTIALIGGFGLIALRLLRK